MEYEYQKPVVTTNDPEVLKSLINQLHEQNYLLNRLVEEKSKTIAIQNETIHILKLLDKVNTK